MRARDAAGNVDATPAEWSWEVGGIPPAVLIESGPDVTTSDRTAEFGFSAEGRDVVFMCALDGGQPSPCLSPKAYNGLPLGPHTFEVSVLENEFTLEEPPVSTWEWTVIDTTGLDTEITHGPPDMTAGVDPEAGGEAEVPFAFIANDTRATFECALDGEAFSECENPYFASGLILGRHMFRVRAVILDPSGQTMNVDPTPARWVFTVVEAPETTIDIGPEGELNGGTARFVFSSTVDNSTFECALDLGPFAPCDSPYELTGLTDGEHILEVRARTRFGIVDTTPEEWSWDVAANLPETAIVSGPKLSTTSTAAAFVFASSEPAEFECSLDGGLFEGCEEGPQPLPGQDQIHHLLTELTLGTHTLRVRALDESDLFDPTPATYTWTIVPEPQTRIDSGPPDTTSDTTATITFSGDLFATFQCALDGGAFAPCTSPKTYTGLAVGWHYVEVRAVDPNGHVDMSPALHNWTVQRPAESSPPDTIITMAPPAQTSSTTATFRLSADELGTTFECKLDAGAWERCPTRVTYTELALGPHTFQARATDAVGNVELEPATHTWTIGHGRRDAARDLHLRRAADGDHQHHLDIQLRGDRDRRDVRVLAEPVRLHALHVAEDLPRHGRRRPLLLRPREGRERQRRPVARHLRVDDRGRHPARHPARRGARRPERQQHRALRLRGHRQHGGRGGRDPAAHVRVPPRHRERERVDRLRHGADLHPPRRGPPHVRRARGGRRRQRRPDAGELRLDRDRPDAARHDGRLRADGHDAEHQRDLQLLG